MANNAQEPSAMDDAGYWIPETEFNRLLRLQAIVGLLEGVESPRLDGIVTMDQVAALAELLVEEFAKIIEQSRFIQLTAQGGHC